MRMCAANAHMGVGREGQGSSAFPWIFIHDTDKVEGGLMVLFFDLVFLLPPPPRNLSADAIECTHEINNAVS